ncbi:hypothetical protein M2475_001844 [Breznakia sp. PF5-3]|uniref:hypothetical protein n=1 Tax=unclassified Breznakia TaxID=2623764 RepID=UPI0024071725|nr:MULTISPECIES: hypothetical protein [unclassified Breznakia]MDF9825389.1 hypothetical protein [Breznakia sp. PM6-1]MDF9836267.1 hypothetical protein [Breznakia sp. PF5-3]MDF9837581.1 hypothetical protein [Breznakia sp. PFB2-8]MDF9860194.1 hypothetical protein [Breznakia sp. PH5-24]
MENIEKNDHSSNMSIEEAQELYFRETKDYLKATTLYKDGKLMRNFGHLFNMKMSSITSKDFKY